MHSAIMFELDEAYVFHLEDNRGRLRRDARLEIPFYGEVEIAYRDDGDEYDFWVKGITISASNGKMGKDCEGWDQEIFQNHPFWKPVERYLQEIAIDDVIEAIRADVSAQMEDFKYQQGKDRARGLMY